MKKIIVSIVIVFAIFIGCKTVNSSSADNKLSLIFESKSKSNVTGLATFIEKNGRITFQAKLSGSLRRPVALYPLLSQNHRLHSLEIHQKI